MAVAITVVADVAAVVAVAVAADAVVEARIVDLNDCDC